ncbi:tetrathionate reductase family octaheme c-type cytochrome [Desulfospira joergensenii]|uniref:tetrathionate reductase family octaheme c-type cytochrome n=1 Tax=Desulfospira joergensenii TaxID=53329 RepID=UPI0003B5BB87|nr:tetrathionate reductase family octaheme c-type cytochrome [Desulfospira joergensenii]
MGKNLMKAVLTLICTGSFLLSPGLGLAAPQSAEDQALGMVLARQAVKSSKSWTTTDHSKLEALNKNFKSGDEITKACLSCHTDASLQFHKTIHWTWKVPSEKEGIMNGKAGHAVNNFCISGNNMEDKGCLDCHAGWNGTEGEVNCLKCHGGEKFPFKETFEDLAAFEGDDDPDTLEIVKELQTDLHRVIKKINMPQRKNCGECHFKGGGGDGVKHGDLDTSLVKPNRMLDVHMAAEGANFTCTRCHTTVKHNIAGRVYTRPASLERKSLIQDDMATKITCESCHSATPHTFNAKMNDHTDKVACQSCHIPEFARVNPTKMWWDWSKAGKLKDGKPYMEEGPYGKHTYKSIKGEFRWEKNVVPEYFWYNGSFDNTGVKDNIDPGQIVKVSQPKGSADDPNSRIHPFKIHRGKQPYDKINKRLVAPLLSGHDGFWTTFNMNDAIIRGNKTLGIPYSGEFDYVETSYAFPTTHMVAPVSEVLNCTECHIREKSRLANITGVYMPGRDKSDFIDGIGMIAVLGALGGVLLHGLGRFFTRNGKES